MKKTHLTFLVLVVISLSIFTRCDLFYTFNGVRPNPFSGTWRVVSDTTIVLDEAGADVTEDWIMYEFTMNTDNSYSLTHKDTNGNIITTSGSVIIDLINLDFILDNDENAINFNFNSDSTQLKYTQKQIFTNMNLTFNNLVKE